MPIATLPQPSKQNPAPLKPIPSLITIGLKILRRLLIIRHSIPQILLRILLSLNILRTLVS